MADLPLPPAIVAQIDCDPDCFGRKLTDDDMARVAGVHVETMDANVARVDDDVIHVRGKNKDGGKRGPDSVLKRNGREKKDKIYGVEGMYVPIATVSNVFPGEIPGRSSCVNQPMALPSTLHKHRPPSKEIQMNRHSHPVECFGRLFVAP